MGTEEATDEGHRPPDSGASEPGPGADEVLPADLTSLVPCDLAGIKADPNLDILAQPGPRAMYILFNTLTFDTPLEDQKVRQALNYAVDKDALISSVLQGYGAKLNGSIITPGYFGYDPQLQPYP